MRRILLRSALALSLLSLCGCSSGGTSIRAILEESCRQAHACRASWPGPFEFETFYGADEAACRATYARVADTVEAAVADGRTRYDPELGAACAATLRASSCEELWAREPSMDCELALVGTGADGAACELGSECAGAHCADGVCASR